MTIETIYSENDTVFFMSANIVKSGKIVGITYQKIRTKVSELYEVELADPRLALQRIDVKLLFPTKEELIAAL